MITSVVGRFFEVSFHASCEVVCYSRGVISLQGDSSWWWSHLFSLSVLWNHDSGITVTSQRRSLSASFGACPKGCWVPLLPLVQCFVPYIHYRDTWDLCGRNKIWGYGFCISCALPVPLTHQIHLTISVIFSWKVRWVREKNWLIVIILLFMGKMNIGAPSG